MLKSELTISLLPKNYTQSHWLKIILTNINTYVLCVKDNLKIQQEE